MTLPNHRPIHRGLIHTLLCSTSLAASIGFGPLPVACSQTQVDQAAVRKNAEDEPRDTPLTRPAMKQYLEDLKQRTPRIPIPELTDDEKKLEIEQPRLFGYEARVRNRYLGENLPGGYNGFWGSLRPNNPAPNANRPTTPPDPALSLDYAFKVRLFWIAARGNNCQYCLGHQESKLLAAGMDEDSIAALDSDWGLYPENEQVAFALAKRLTTEPHLLSDADIDACRPHYSDAQLIEMICSVAGYNAINRWKEGTGLPQSQQGGNFGAAPGATTASSEPHSYLTPTSPKFASVKTRVAKAKLDGADGIATAPTRCVRPALEQGTALADGLGQVATRKPRLPLVDEATARSVMETLAPAKLPQWMRLLANFPVAGKNFAAGLLATQKSDALSPALQAKIDWVLARQDRAWYAMVLALERLRDANLTQEEMAALDDPQRWGNDLKSPLDESDKALLIVARNLSASPIVLTDAQVARAIAIAGPRAVVQTIHYTTYRAAFHRITEAAHLGKD